MKHWFEHHDRSTERGSRLIDLTRDVRAAVERSEVVNGMALVDSPNTTCAILADGLEDGNARASLFGAHQPVFFCGPDSARASKASIQVLGE